MSKRSHVIVFTAGLAVGTLCTAFAQHWWLGSEAGARSTTSEPEMRWCVDFKFATGRKSTWRYCADDGGEEGRLQCERQREADVDMAKPGENEYLGQCKLNTGPKGLAELK